MTGKEGKKKSECVRCEINLSSEGDILVLNFSAVRSICVGHLCAHTCTSCPVHCETTSVLCTFYKKATSTQFTFFGTYACTSIFTGYYANLF